MNKAVQFFKDWMLPLAIATGISLYLFYHFTPFLNTTYYNYNIFNHKKQTNLLDQAIKYNNPQVVVGNLPNL